MSAVWDFLSYFTDRKGCSLETLSEDLNISDFCGQIAVAVGLIAAGVAITLSTAVWRAAFVAFALLAFAAAYACSQGVLALTQNYVRPHRK